MLSAGDVSKYISMAMTIDKIVVSTLFYPDPNNVEKGFIQWLGIVIHRLIWYIYIGSDMSNVISYKTVYEMTTNVRFFLSHDETHKENQVFQSYFNFVCKPYNNATNNYAEVIFSLVY